MAATPHC